MFSALNSVRLPTGRRSWSPSTSRPHHYHRRRHYLRLRFSAPIRSTAASSPPTVPCHVPPSQRPRPRALPTPSHAKTVRSRVALAPLPRPPPRARWAGARTHARLRCSSRSFRWLPMASAPTVAKALSLRSACSATIATTAARVTRSPRHRCRPPPQAHLLIHLRLQKCLHLRPRLRLHRPRLGLRTRPRSRRSPRCSIRASAPSST